MSVSSLPWAPKLDPSPGLSWGPHPSPCASQRALSLGVPAASAYSRHRSPTCRVCVHMPVLPSIFMHLQPPLGELMVCGSQDRLLPISSGLTLGSL